jgi:RimJ/RimL family protein N-acetyltransferase
MKNTNLDINNKLNISDSQRLSFRLMDESDLDFLYALYQDESVMQYINGGQKTSWHDKVKIFLPRMMSYRNEEKGWGLWQVTVKNSNLAIGWVLLRPMGFFSDEVEWQNIELGWRLKKDAWGLGYATEAANAVIKAIKQQQPTIQKLTAVALSENLASISIMKKLGMQFQGIKAIEDPFRQRHVDCVVYSVVVDRDF